MAVGQTGCNKIHTHTATGLEHYVQEKKTYGNSTEMVNVI
jgi:hypothetical protein